MPNGWRSLIVESPEQLSLQAECLVVQGVEEISVPLCQLRSVMVSSMRGSISLPLLNALNEQHISLLLCNEKREPTCELVPIAGHFRSAGNIHRQSSWTPERKAAVWQSVVQAKIRNQISALLLFELPVPPELSAYLAAIQPGDSTNREGLAARLYFSSLFGSSFLRHTEDDVNAALNYGYAILRSECTRLIAAHGYHPALGIHHCSQTNPFNLSCDFMEPFRPFVDVLVRQSPDRSLDWERKKELISVLYLPCCWNGKRMTLQNAMESSLLSWLQMLSEETACVKEMHIDFSA